MPAVPAAAGTHSRRLRASGGEPARGWYRLVPDLVVEIDSPGRRPAIEQSRIQDYLEAGVRLLWVIHTATRSATVYRNDGTLRLVRDDGQLAGDDVLPGLRIKMSELFPTD